PLLNRFFEDRFCGGVNLPDQGPRVFQGSFRCFWRSNRFRSQIRTSTNFERKCNRITPKSTNLVEWRQRDCQGRNDSHRTIRVIKSGKLLRFRPKDVEDFLRESTENAA